jgi:NitT/TauT family transport system substrate-binding protein
LVQHAQHRVADGLRNAGLTPVIKDQTAELAPNEVNLMIMPPPDMPPALASKKIDAFIVAEPFNAAGELLAGGKMLRFTGDMWKNHPCCVVCMNENTVAAKPEWTQKVMNAVVKAQIYSQENKAEVARMMSKDGKKYLPMPAKVVERAMTFYPGRLHGPGCQPPRRGVAERAHRLPALSLPKSATKLIVEEMNKTLVGGDKTFLEGLDPHFVAEDLVDYKHVKVAMEKYKDWSKNVPGVIRPTRSTREEVVKI